MVAHADITREVPSISYDIDPDVIQDGLILLATFAGGIMVDTAKSLIKELLTSYLKDKLKRKKQPKVKVEAIRQPGGAYLLVVSEEEQ